MDTEELDYKAICDQLLHNNEKIRIKILKIKNEEISFFEALKEKIADMFYDPLFPVYANLAIVLLALIVVPIMSWLLNCIFRRKQREG